MGETIGALRAAELLADRNDQQLCNHARDLAYSVIVRAGEVIALRDVLAQTEMERDGLREPASRARRYEQAIRTHRLLCDERDRTHAHERRDELSRKINEAHHEMMNALRALHAAAGHV